MSEWLRCRVVGEEFGGQMRWGVELWERDEMRSARYGVCRRVQPAVRFCRICNRGQVSPAHAEDILENFCSRIAAEE